MGSVPALISTFITLTLLVVTIVTVPMFWEAVKTGHTENRYRLVARYYGASLMIMALWRSTTWTDLALAGDAEGRIPTEVNWGVTLAAWAFVLALTTVSAIGFYRTRETN